ncbi:MAG: HAD hydrolase family protein [Phycisphaerales bacterium]|nr:HAD hydrolase family protein [Phycisphaerales bacterium]
MDWSAIRFLFLDVDGVLTDGGLALGAECEVHKVFHVHDGAAVQRWKGTGGQVLLLTGRVSDMVTRRAEELGIEHVRQGVQDKGETCRRMLADLGGEPRQAACVGDDLPDIPVMRTCAWSAAVADARPVVKRAASYVTRKPGGRGAVAEVVDLLLRKRRDRKV